MIYSKTYNQAKALQMTLETTSINPDNKTIEEIENIINASKSKNLTPQEQEQIEDIIMSAFDEADDEKTKQLKTALRLKFHPDKNANATEQKKSLLTQVIQKINATIEVINKEKDESKLEDLEEIISDDPWLSWSYERFTSSHAQGPYFFAINTILQSRLKDAKKSYFSSVDNNSSDDEQLSDYEHLKKKPTPNKTLKEALEKTYSRQCHTKRIQVNKQDN